MATDWIHESYQGRLRTKIDSQLTPAERRFRTFLNLGRPVSVSLIMSLGSYFLGLSALALSGTVWASTFLPSFAPTDGHGMETLWQVQAALVTVALPFLFVLIPLVTGIHQPSPTRAGLLLMADTLINAILWFALAGLAWNGVVIIWVVNDATTWISFVFVFIPTLIAVGFAYLRSARILIDPPYVEMRSGMLAEALADEEIVRSLSIQYANGRLTSELNRLGVPYGPPPWGADDTFSYIRCWREGRLSDVNEVLLQSWVQQLHESTRSVGPEAVVANPNDEGEDADSEALKGADIRWLVLIDDHVNVESPFVAIAGPSLGDDALARLERSLQPVLGIRS